MNDKQTLFLSKAFTAWECPRKFHWIYNLWLAPKEESPALRRGRIAHSISATASRLRQKGLDRDTALALGIAEDKEIMQITEDERAEISGHVFAIWDKIQDRKVTEVEKVLTFNPDYPWIWKGRVDFIEEENGFWIGEIKTTSSYSSTIQRLYHKGIQPWVYLYIFTKLYQERARGIRMYVSSRPSREAQKALGIPPGIQYCTVEEIPIQEHMLEYAWKFMMDSASYISGLDVNLQNRSACQTFMGECPYLLLCDPHVTPESLHFQDLVTQMFKKEDPEEHLREEG